MDIVGNLFEESYFLINVCGVIVLVYFYDLNVVINLNVMRIFYYFLI